MDVSDSFEGESDLPGAGSLATNLPPLLSLLLSLLLYIRKTWKTWKIFLKIQVKKKKDNIII
jgi:hypothetical protein